MTALQPTRTSLDYPEVPVGAVLAGAARRYGERTALHFAGRELSFTALYARACAIARALGDAGIGRGDVVAIHLPNCPQYAIGYFGILLSGATFSPTNPLLPPADLAAQLADCGAVAAISWVPAERSAGGASIGAAPALAVVRARTSIRLLPHRNVVVNALQFVKAASSPTVPALRSTRQATTWRRWPRASRARCASAGRR